MLSYVDRIQLVVPDRDAAVGTWQDLFGAEKTAEDSSGCLGARRTTVRAGATDFEFLEPSGPGPVAEFAATRGQGLYGVGFSTPDLAQMVRHFDSHVVPFVEEDERVYLLPPATHGMPAVISQDGSRDRAGIIRHVYEVTNVVDDWQDTAAHYTRIFGLDPTRYSRIKSHNYGYDGTLTLFNPPDRLDRIEITQTNAEGAMARFYAKHGPSLYMCYIETDDVPALAERLDAHAARYEHSDRSPEVGLFIHPSALHGMLMGVSRTNFAWVWSGRPELAGEGAQEIHPVD